MAPGKPGAAHSHDFFGNKGTNAHSTAASLRTGDTSCTRALDRSAYWVPTLLRDGKPVDPEHVLVYYMGRTRDVSRVIPFPSGLRMIAGKANASQTQDPIATWMCKDGDANRSIPATGMHCAEDSSLRLRIIFPDCWDGRRLDSPDHQAHMSYARAGVCPATHPVALPGITMFVIYATTGGPNLVLSSGGVHSGHADFFNGWDQTMQRQLVRGCLNAGRRCPGNETPDGPTTPTSYEQKATYLRCMYQRRHYC